MRETELSQKVVGELIRRGHVMRVENTTCRGVPDINFCVNGMEGWIELKVAIGGKVILRPEQYAWGRRRADNNGRVFVLAYDPHYFLLWRYPRVLVTPYKGKYLAITNAPWYSSQKLNEVILSCLLA